MSDAQMLKVAMVDDEEPLCLAVARILNKYQVHVDDVGVDVAYVCTHFGSGEQFFEEIDNGTEFDLLLVDLKLPGMSGLDILEQLRGQGRGILAIMITAYATFETAVQATKLGAYDFLPKPFSPEELRYAVRKATDQLIISREARRLAEEKRQVRFNFISVLSHELKAPINAIEGYLKILQADELPERLPMIERSLVRLDGMRKLIFDLLDLTRIESGQKQRELVPVDLCVAAQTAIDMFAAEAAGRDIGLTLRAPEPVEMVADLSELEIGMTPEESAKLFTEFMRIKNEETYKILGSGLGLSTVRKLAQLYGGDASVKSDKGQGSVFTVTLRDADPASLPGPAAD
jgi:two-component system sensor histidine kinase/response regulator